MAGPHVAGLAALLISANPGLANQPALLRRMIEVSANPNVLVLAQTCGGISSTSIPNNQFGWGRIDAAAAVELVLQQLTGLAPQVQTLAVPPNAEAAINIQTTNRMPAGSGLDLGAVALRAIIPAETTFISATSPYIRNQDLITWTVGSLPAGSVYSVTLNLGAPDVLYAEIPILSDTLAGSAVPISASGSLTVSALQASLSSPLQSASNLPLTYTFTISNAHGSENLATLVANSPLPPGTILISASQPFTQVGNTISWNRDMLEPGAHWIVFFTIQPDPDAWISDPVIIGTATVQAAGVSKPTVKPFQTFMLAPWRNYIPLIKR
jgi:hypothetical protein